MTSSPALNASLSHSAANGPSLSQEASPTLRVATYNIHKGVRGVGPQKRLEIHNLCLGVEALKADLVFLQEVRQFHHREAQQFQRTWFGWPDQGQAEFLAPDGYEVAYRTNAITKHGEHGNALLSRWPLGDVGHHDVSDHRFEQRGLLHVPVLWQGRELHTIVAHLGLMHSGRLRQVQRLVEYVDKHVPAGALLVVAGDFNDWGERLDAPMRAHGLSRASLPDGRSRLATFPSRMPFFSLDRIYTRGLRCLHLQVPKGPGRASMADHLPLVAELPLETT